MGSRPKKYAKFSETPLVDDKTHDFLYKKEFHYRLGYEKAFADSNRDKDKMFFQGVLYGLIPFVVYILYCFILPMFTS